MSDCRCADMKCCREEIEQLKFAMFEKSSADSMISDSHSELETAGNKTEEGLCTATRLSVGNAVKHMDKRADGDNTDFFNKINRCINDLEIYYDELEQEDTDFHEELEEEEDPLLNVIP